MLHPYTGLIPAISLLILATSLSCTSRSNDDIQQLNLDLATAEPLSFSELASAVEYVALDKRLGYMGDNYELIKLTSDHILIVENQNPERVINLFDRSGRGIVRIHQVGEGPGKYYKVSDAWINEKERTIELLDGIQQKIVVYDFNGSFLTDINLPGNFDHFIKFADQNYLFDAGNNRLDSSLHSLHFYQEGDIRSSYLEFSEAFAGYTFSGYPFSYVADEENNFLFFRYFDPVLYTFSDEPDSFRPLFHIDLSGVFVDKPWVDKILSLSPPEQVQMLNQSGRIYKFDKVSFRKKDILLTLINSSERRRYYTFIDPIRESAQIYYRTPYAGESNGFDAGPLPHRLESIGPDGELVFVFPAFDMIEHLRDMAPTVSENAEANPALQKRYQQLKQQFSDFSEQNNPILIIVTTRTDLS